MTKSQMKTQTKVKARDLEEGQSLLLRPCDGLTSTVESVSTRWAGIGLQERTTIYLADHKTVTLSPDYLVTVLS